MEKQTLKVNDKSSKAINAWKTFFLVIAWICLIGGIIVAIVGIEDATSFYHPDSSTLIIGIAIAISSIPDFVIASLLRGLITITEASEYYKAKFESEYEI